MTPALRKPVRRFAVRVAVEADDWEHAKTVLQEAIGDILRDGPVSHTMGGASVSLIVECAEDPTMTHERYFGELHAYLDAAKRAEATT